MPKNENVTMWECDRCGEKHFAAVGDEYEKQWGQPKRINAATNETTCTLCPRCLSDYKIVVANHDKDFSLFLKGER